MRNGRWREGRRSCGRALPGPQRTCRAGCKPVWQHRSRSPGPPSGRSPSPFCLADVPLSSSSATCRGQEDGREDRRRSDDSLETDHPASPLTLERSHVRHSSELSCPPSLSFESAVCQIGSTWRDLCTTLRAASAGATSKVRPSDVGLQAGPDGMTDLVCLSLCADLDPGRRSLAAVPRTPSPPTRSPSCLPQVSLGPAAPGRNVKRLRFNAPQLPTLAEENGNDDDGVSDAQSVWWSSSSSDEGCQPSAPAVRLPSIGLGLGSLSDLELVGDGPLDSSDGTNQRSSPHWPEEGTQLLELMLDSLLLEAGQPARLPAPSHPAPTSYKNRPKRRKGLPAPPRLNFIDPAAFPLPPATSPALSSRSASSILNNTPSSSSSAFPIASPSSAVSWSSDDQALHTPDGNEWPTWDLKLTPWMLTPPPSSSALWSDMSLLETPSLLPSSSTAQKYRRLTTVSTLARPRRPVSDSQVVEGSTSVLVPVTTSSKSRPVTTSTHPFAGPSTSSWNRPSRPAPPPLVPLNPLDEVQPAEGGRRPWSVSSKLPPSPSPLSTVASGRALPRRSPLPSQAHFGLAHWDS